MSMATATLEEAAAPDEQFADDLREQTAACRVMTTRLGTTKTLTASQKDKAALPFEAKGTSISASKKLLDTRNSYYRAVTSTINEATNYWESVTVPYPERGIRLIRRDKLDEFAVRIAAIKDELEVAVAELNLRFEEMRVAAKAELGELYNAADYPDSLEGLWSIEWDVVSVEPPEYLRQLNPVLFEQEWLRVRTRFGEAVTMAEQAFAVKLSELIDHLTERMEPEQVKEWQYEGPDEAVLMEQHDGLTPRRTELAERLAVNYTVLDDAELNEVDEGIADLEKMLRWSRAEDIESDQHGYHFYEAPAGGGRRLKIRTETVDEHEAATALTAMGCTVVREKEVEKKFRDSLVDNFQEFFQQFQAMSVGSNPDLDAMVATAADVMSGVEARTLRGGGDIRATITEGLSEVRERLEPVVVAKKKRGIRLAD